MLAAGLSYCLKLPRDAEHVNAAETAALDNEEIANVRPLFELGEIK
jgi:hypothetical protein